jgi:hypothetical protein
LNGRLEAVKLGAVGRDVGGPGGQGVTRQGSSDASAAIGRLLDIDHAR